MDQDLRMTRYARQTQVFGETAQARLAGARVLVIGAGGLGAPVLSYLAGAGVGRIDIVDPDHVSLSNLHRQTLFSTAQVGLPKSEAAATALRALNPEIIVSAHQIAFDPSSGPDMIAQTDLVLDCADSFAASYAASDLCLAACKPLITASVLEMSGYVCGVCGGAPSLRAVFPDPPDTAASCATAGVSGPVVGLIGAAQAQMALSHLTGVGEAPLGLTLRLDAASWRFSRFRFDQAPEPARPLAFVAPSALSDADLVLDLRSADEASALVIPTALRHQTGTTPKRPAPGQRTVLACATGLRAWRLGITLSPDWPGEIVLAAVPPSNSET
jgi:molybdopterin/thiamine biosynthesis adenylyltransferase